MLPLSGRYPCQLDANNRLAVPAKLREQLGQEAEAYWYVSLGQRAGSLDLWPEEIFANLSNQLPSGMLSSEEALKFEEFLYSHSERVRMDKQGRVVLPEMLLEEVPLGKELMLVGRRNRMVIYPRPLWEEVEKEQMTQQTSIREQAYRTLLGAGK